MDNAQYMQAFIDESIENTQILNRLCLRLEQGDNDDEVFAAMFRAAHTLKGMSGTMGFLRMAALTHKLEDVMGNLRQNPTLLTETIQDCLFSCLDALDEMLDSIRHRGDEGITDERALIAKLDNAFVKERGESGPHSSLVNPEVYSPLSANRSVTTLELDHAVQTVLMHCQREGVESGVLSVTIDKSCVMKGVRAIVVARSIEEHADCLHCVPDAILMQDGAYEDTLSFVIALRYSDVNTVLHAVKNISEVENVTFLPFEAGNVSLETGTHIRNNNQVIPDKKMLPRPNAIENSTRLSETNERTVRVPVERLDNLMNLLSEMVLDKTRLSTLADQTQDVSLKDVSEHMGRISNDLQSAVMSLRMMPVENLFQRFPRMVRDLSKSLNKEIQLEMSGLHTEFDRTLIEEMGEVLVHLIRNAADHGLEATAKRIAQGKPQQGSIFLRAYAAGQNVFIEVADDGGGISRDSVLSKALENGLISTNQMTNISNQDVYNLLFSSGFSTASEVTDISGRGVGLDAVMRKVQSLGGAIHIESNLGQGTTFCIKLPLTLAIIQALIVRVSGDKMAIPISAVEEVAFVTKKDLKRVHGQSVLSIRNKLIPILDVGSWFYTESTMTGELWHMVICRVGDRRLAVCVDEFLGQQEIVNKSLGEYLSHVNWFSGATILGDGRIALILDVHTCLSALVS